MGELLPTLKTSSSITGIMQHGEATRDRIFAYVEASTIETRRHSAIGDLSTIEMELKALGLTRPFFRGEDQVLSQDALVA